ADPLRHHRGLGVVDDDALLVVEPARPLVNLGDDRVDAERQDAVAQGPAGGIEYLALPGEDVDQLGDVIAELRAWRHDGGAVGLAIGNRAGLLRTEQRVQFGLRLGEKLFDDLAHRTTPCKWSSYA